MLPFLVYVEHRKSEYKWEMYMWMLWKIRTQGFDALIAE